ncbi:MAG: cell division protein FtsA [Pseudomonadota bacterium]
MKRKSARQSSSTTEIHAVAALTHTGEARERIVSVLDIGSSKTCCLVAAVDGDAVDAARPGAPLDARVIGSAELRSAGIKAGSVVDLARAEDVVRRVIAKAEASAGREIEQIAIAVSCGRLASANFTVSADVVGERVSAADVDRLFEAGRNFAASDGRTLLHLNALGFGIDESDGVADPRDMLADRLTADLHAVTADVSPLRNLTALIDRAYLDVSRLVATPFASATAAITDEEARLGCLCIDLGAGTTTMAMFAEGHFIHADAIALGAHQITLDIARRLGAPIEEAERLKTLHASLVTAQSDEREMVSYPVVDADEVGLYEVSRRELQEIVRPRIAELLDLVSDRLTRSGMRDFASDQVVLTGGGAALTGLRDFAESRLDMHIRIASPRTIDGLAEDETTPAHTAALGLLRLTAPRPGADPVRTLDANAMAQTSIFAQMGRWLRQSLWDDDRDDARRTGT